MKKLFAFLMITVLVAGTCLAGCGNTDKSPSENSSDNTLIQTDDQPPTVDNQDEENNNDTIENNDDDDKVKTEEDAKSKAEADKKAEAEKKAKAEADKKAKAEADKKAKEESQGMAWPNNKYTSLLPKPSTGTLQSTGIKDGIYCMLFTGTTISDAKAYAATLISSGYSNEVTETISGGTYLFGGGNASGAFAVVNYQDGHMMVGIQP